MRKLNGIFRGVCLSLVLALAGMLGSPAPARAELGALVPAYFYPGTGGPGGVGDGWAAMAAAASKIPITAIFNPNSGPASSADPAYANAIMNLENAGGHVVAYVPTYYAGSIDSVHGALSYVEGEIKTYLSQYSGQINGFFIDQMTNDNSSADLGYYNSLYTFIKGLSPSYQVIGNPGAETIPDYLAPSTQGADVLVTYENQAQFYAGTSPPAWVSGSSPNHFANLIYNESTAGDMMNDIALAVQRNVGYVYVTDQYQIPNPAPPPPAFLNPWTQLPSYWDQEVTEIASFVPEPGPLTKLASGGLFAALGIAVKRWCRKRAPV